MCQGIIGACEAGILRAEHFLHLRCELSFAHALEIFETLMDHRAVKLVSLMDHTPGDRQFVNVERYRFYYMKKYNMSDEQFQAFYARRRDDQERYSARHRAAIVERARTRKHVLASHDDATLDHVDEAIRDGITIAEFPTTFEAARAAHQRGLAVLAGGPNILLGGSHSGNVAVCDLAAQGILDIVSSDYVPSSIVQAAFALVDAGVGLDIAGAIRLISHNPAEAAGLCDRGAIAPGLRADLVRVRRVDGMPIVVSVWRASERIV
jgi:alpha-D-ribose 1-methylphosphonate 5-triphosphate diphosphatase